MIHRIVVALILLLGLAACGGPSEGPADATAVAPGNDSGVSQPAGDQTAYPAYPMEQDNAATGYPGAGYPGADPAATGYPGAVPLDAYPSPVP